MIPADPSAWVNYVRATPTDQTDKLDKLPGNEPLAIGHLVLSAVRQGSGSERDFNEATRLPTSLTVVHLGGRAVAVQAAKNTRSLRALGVTVRKTIETIFATGGIRSGCILLYGDRDLDAFVTHFGLHSG